MWILIGCLACRAGASVRSLDVNAVDNFYLFCEIGWVVVLKGDFMFLLLSRLCDVD